MIRDDIVKLLENMKPFLTDKERAEKLKELTGYEEAKKMLAECERESEQAGYDFRRGLIDCEEYHAHWMSSDRVINAYPTAYYYIQLEDKFEHRGDPAYLAIYRYAMDRVLQGDDPEAVNREAYDAGRYLYWYRRYLPELLDADPDDLDEFHRRVGMYCTARVMSKPADEETA